MKFKKYLIESSLSRIMQHITNDKSFGVVSASRKSNSDKENDDLYKELIKDVRKMGYGYIKLRGGYKEETGFVNEKSLFIPNITKNDIIKLGKKYNQDSVLYKDYNGFYEIGTNEFTGVGKILTRFKTDDISIDDTGEVFTEFFSKLVKGSHANKKFLFVSEHQTGNMFVGGRVLYQNIISGKLIDNINIL